MSTRHHRKYPKYDVQCPNCTVFLTIRMKGACPQEPIPMRCEACGHSFSKVITPADRCVEMSSGERKKFDALCREFSRAVHNAMKSAVEQDEKLDGYVSQFKALGHVPCVSLEFNLAFLRIPRESRFSSLVKDGELVPDVFSEEDMEFLKEIQRPFGGIQKG